MEMKKNQKRNMLFVRNNRLLFPLDLIDCFKGKFYETPKKEAYSALFKKFLENLISWVHTAKCYTIFHVGLQDPATINDTAAEIKERENFLYCYAKKPEENDHRIFF